MHELDDVRALYAPATTPDPAGINRQREQLMTTIQESTGASADHDGQPAAEHDLSDLASRRRWRIARRAALIALPIAAIGAAAAAVMIPDRAPSTEGQSFGCISDEVVTVLPNRGISPVEQCADVWKQGDMVAEVTSAPPLVACVNKYGGVVVLEGTSNDDCTTKSMSGWEGEASYLAMGRVLTDAHIQLIDERAASGDHCVSIDQWKDAIFDAGGSEDWTFEVNDDDASPRCYNVDARDPEAGTVLLTGAPTGESLGCDPRVDC